MRAARKQLNERSQLGPADYLVYLAKKNFFSGLLVQKIKVERDLIHDCYLVLPSSRAVVEVDLILQSFPSMWPCGRANAVD